MDGRKKREYIFFCLKELSKGMDVIKMKMLPNSLKCLFIESLETENVIQSFP